GVLANNILLQPGSVNLAGGEFIVNGLLAAQGDGRLIQDGANFTVQGSATVDNFELRNGILGGAGTLSITQSFHWARTAGEMQGTGVTFLDNNCVTTMDSPIGAYVIRQRTLRNWGTLYWDVNGPSEWDILDQALVENWRVMNISGGSGQKKFAGSVEGNVIAKFINYDYLGIHSASNLFTEFEMQDAGGRIELFDAAQLTLETATFESSGWMEASAGCAVNFDFGPYQFTAANLRGDGIYRVRHDARIIAASSTTGIDNLEVSGAGQMAGDGTFEIARL